MPTDERYAWTDDDTLDAHADYRAWRLAGQVIAARQVHAERDAAEQARERRQAAARHRQRVAVWAAIIGGCLLFWAGTIIGIAESLH